MTYLLQGVTSFSYDPNGNLTNDGTKSYARDARNRLSAMTGASFTYDPLGRRVSKTIGASTTSYLYDGVNPVQEGGANLLTGLGVDQYFTRTDSTGTRSFLTDALGSTLALADATGTVQTSYTYEPFGKTTTTGAASTNSFQYTGRENDGTGLYFYRARYYSPTLQRFMSEDPVGFRGGDANLYAYVRNRPVNARDPLGLWTPDFHENTTRAAASACGADAEALAQAVRGVDFSLEPLPSLSTLDPWSAEHGMPGTDWWSYASQQYSTAVDTGSLQALGQALHALQDAYAHDLAGAGMLDHLNPFGVRPDDPLDRANSARARAAEEATRASIRDFMKGRGDKPKC